MMTKEKMTVSSSSAATDGKQPICINTTRSIADLPGKGNLQAINKAENSEGISGNMVGNLDAKSLEEILDTPFPPQIPLIEDFLYTGTYLFAGAPKLGKSFFMAQIGFHISTGQPIWNHAVHKGTVLYLALEDNFARIQKRLSKMFDLEDTDKFFFAVESKSLKKDWICRWKIL